jgi:hypothetical protein
MWMKKTILIALLLCLAGSITSFADIIVYENDYEGETVGNDFPAWNWGDNGTVHTAVYTDEGGNIIVKHTGTISNPTTAARSMRFGSKWDITLTGNTSSNPADYTISFDLRSVSGNWDPISLEFFVLTKEATDQGYGSGASAYAQADGWVHVSANLADLSVGWWQGQAWDMTNPAWSIEVGGPPYPGTSVPTGTPAFDQIWLMDNLKITMIGGAETKLQLAKNPSPDNEETDVCRDVVLSWTPGKFAPLTNGHKVFFSDDFYDVNEGLDGVIQDTNTYTPPELPEWGTTYYWRVDEANSTAPTGWDQGDVWQFTVELFAFPIEDVIAKASSNVAGKDPANTLTLEGDLHSTNTSEMWLSDSELPGQAWIEYEFDKVYSLHQMWVWNYNGEFPLNWYGLNSVTIEYSLTGTDGDWTPLEGVPDFNQAPGSADYAHNTTVNFGGKAAKYIRITANSNFSNGIFENYGLSEVRFFYIPVYARRPSPDDEAPDVVPDMILTWRAGRDAAEHKVYFSSDEQAVTEGTITPEIVPGNGCEASYDPGDDLDLGTTYYWRIDEVNGDQTWQGDVWSYTTADYLVVDDMEFYGDSNLPGEEGSRVFYVWRDGFTVTDPYNIPSNGTASQVGHWPPPIMETGTVHGGSQSMPFYYLNDGTHSVNPNVYYSQITAQASDLPIGENWTRNGVNALTLYFYGDLGNDVGEPMWVKLTDQSNSSGRVTYGTYADEDVSNLADQAWHEWNIELVDFGVDLEHVKEISIGIGEPDAMSPGGTGLMYFDDIRLYPAR